MDRPLRIALAAPPLERVPPRAYGGTERIVHELAAELHARGHEVTTFASADSSVAGRLVPTVPRALRPDGFGGDPSPWFLATVLAVLERASEFDVIHSHIEWYSSIIATVAPLPVVTTWHGRLDFPWARDMLTTGGAHQVAISRSQAATHPDVDWTAVVHNGLSLAGAPFNPAPGDSLCFVGRAAPEKGILDAIEIARRSGRPIRLAVKEGHTPSEKSYHEQVVLPAVRAMGRDAEYLGELTGPERDQLFAESAATVMPGAWPEPFGLVAIESLACGTPLLARRIGALPEIVRDGVDGFFGDDVTQLAFHVDHLRLLDRAAIRASVLERFSARRMADDYERVYRSLVAVGEPVGPGRPAPLGTGWDGASLPPPADVAPPSARRVRPPIRFGSRPETVVDGARPVRSQEPSRSTDLAWPRARPVSRPGRPALGPEATEDRDGPSGEPEQPGAASGSRPGS